MWYGFSELIMQIIFKHGNNQNSSLGPDKELSTLIDITYNPYGTPSPTFSYTGAIALLKVVRFFGSLCTFDDWSPLNIRGEMADYVSSLCEIYDPTYDSYSLAYS